MGDRGSPEEQDARVAGFAELPCLDLSTRRRALGKQAGLRELHRARAADRRQAHARGQLDCGVELDAARGVDRGSALSDPAGRNGAGFDLRASRIFDPDATLSRPEALSWRDSPSAGERGGRARQIAASEAERGIADLEARCVVITASCSEAAVGGHHMRAESRNRRMGNGRRAARKHVAIDRAVVQRDEPGVVDGHALDRAALEMGLASEARDPHGHARVLWAGPEAKALNGDPSIGDEAE
jgi:hypothetical protein